MVRLFAALTLALALVAMPFQSTAQQAAGSFAIEHVTVINVEDGTRAADQTVVLAGNRITVVGPAATVKSPAGVRIVDGRGKFLIPGIWEMHGHPLLGGMQRSLPLAVARGITGIREMASSFDMVTEARKAIDAGMIAPRLMLSGPGLDGVPLPPQMAGLQPGVLLVITTPDEGRAIVNRLASMRVDYVKVRNGLTRETYFAIAEEAKKWRLPFTGHLPPDVSIVEASDAGQNPIEHLNGLAALCAADPAALTPAAPNSPPLTQPIELNRAKCDETVRRLVRNKTWLTPTIGAPGSGDARLRKFNLQITQIAAKAGVRLLGGTDWPGINFANGGRNPQDEMAGLVEAGLTPLEALRTTTVNAATLFDMKNQLGSVERGKLADLLLLDADPLLDIANTKRINAVVINGRLIDSALRQKLLDDEQATQRKSN
jgi:imidazolonepropionase-like amidohydrolase